MKSEYSIPRYKKKFLTKKLELIMQKGGIDKKKSERVARKMIDEVDQKLAVELVKITFENIIFDFNKLIEKV